MERNNLKISQKITFFSNKKIKRKNDFEKKKKNYILLVFQY